MTANGVWQNAIGKLLNYALAMDRACGSFQVGTLLGETFDIAGVLYENAGEDVES